MTTAVERARLLAEEARDLTMTISEMEAELADRKHRLNRIVTDELVDLMHAADLDRIGLPAQGNLPGFDLKLNQFVAASIPKAWPEERREAAFDALPLDLVKITVTVRFRRQDGERARALAKKLRETMYDVTVEREVHHATLAAWVRAQLEDHAPLPDLDTIGALVGNRVKITQREG